MFVPDIGESFGIEKKYLWIPSLVFFGWIIYIGLYRAKIKFSDSFELSLIERVRGWGYGLSFAITLFFNALLLMKLLNPVVGIIIVGILLTMAVLILPKLFFEKYWMLFNPLQKKHLMRVLHQVGVVSIYLSVTILNAQNTIFTGDFSLSLLIDSVLTLLLIIVIFYAERKSRELANSLAVSLEKTRVEQRLQVLKKKKRKRE